MCDKDEAQLDSSTIKGGKEWFNAVDDDGSRTLEHEELMAALKAAQIPCNEATISEMIRMMDLNRDGVIGWEEFSSFMSAGPAVLDVSRRAEFNNGKNLLTGEYILPSGTTLNFGVMIGKLKRDKLMQDGHSSRQRWVEVASSPALLAAEVGAIQQAAECRHTGSSSQAVAHTALLPWAAPLQAATAIHANIAKQEEQAASQQPGSAQVSSPRALAASRLLASISRELRSVKSSRSLRPSRSAELPPDSLANVVPDRSLQPTVSIHRRQGVGSLLSPEPPSLLPALTPKPSHSGITPTPSVTLSHSPPTHPATHLSPSSRAWTTTLRLVKHAGRSRAAARDPALRDSHSPPEPRGALAGGPGIRGARRHATASEPGPGWGAGGPGALWARAQTSLGLTHPSEQQGPQACLPPPASLPGAPGPLRSDVWHASHWSPIGLGMAGGAAGRGQGQGLTPRSHTSLGLSRPGPGEENVTLGVGGQAAAPGSSMGTRMAIRASMTDMGDGGGTGSDSGGDGGRRPMAGRVVFSDVAGVGSVGSSVAVNLEGGKLGGQEPGQGQLHRPRLAGGWRRGSQGGGVAEQGWDINAKLQSPDPRSPCTNTPP
ncbi:hypothetical protein QJQ45_022560 [Haematococcus lacustris]|nr:hypothetical protein QJQ45_022560 [Haematococcus lacustris]